MKLKVIGIGNSKKAPIEELKSLPEFRKTTNNMMLAYLSIEEAINSINSKIPNHGIKPDSLILGSNHGELETTVNFLEALENLKIARPLLFQNSLHNATTGFLAMKLGLTGPTISISNQHFTGEQSIDTASSLLEEEDCNFCLVTCVDSQVAQLSNEEGCGTLLLTREDIAQKFKIRSFATIKAIKYINSFKEVSLDAHDSNAIEKIIEHIQSEKITEVLTLEKINGSKSIIYFDRENL